MPDLLLVEDERVVREAVARLCRAEGLSVDEVESAEQARGRLAEASHRLAIVDLMLPGRSGFELLRELRDAGSPMPAVAISGFATTANALESFRLGAFDFLPKPFDEPELVGVVRRGLRCAERGGTGAAAAGVAGAERYFLGRHSWAAPEPDGSVLIGVAESFPGVLGAVTRLDLPAANHRVTQGQEAARFEGPEEVHRVWSPLGGRTLAANSRLAETPELVDRSPFGDGWLVRIVPAALDSEIGALTRRPAGGG